MQAYVNFFRRFSILARLLIGFSIALAPMVGGLAWVGTRLSALRVDLRTPNADGAASVAAQLSGIQVDMWLALAVCAMVGVVLIIGVTLSIIQPMNQLHATVKGIAAGDLSEVLDTRWRDEVGQMTHALAAMRQALADVVLNIHRSAQAVSEAARNLSQGNADLSQRTETSAARLQETAGSMEQIQAMARVSAASAQRVAELTNEAERTASRAGQSLADGVAIMGALTASSHKMADIVGVIDAIAFQTNILALNAAVEAARAGEQGRGFAVVASEVRALASRSAASAKEIKGLIQTAIAQAQTGAQSVESVGVEMARVVASVNTVAEHVTEIKNAADDQCSGIVSVSRSVSELDSVTQRNSALVEQAASGADELQNEARRLIQSVAVFRLPADAVHG